MRRFEEIELKESERLFGYVVELVSDGVTVYYCDKSRLHIGEVQDETIGKLRFLTSQAKIDNNSISFFYEVTEEEK